MDLWVAWVAWANGKATKGEGQGRGGSQQFGRGAVPHPSVPGYATASDTPCRSTSSHHVRDVIDQPETARHGRPRMRRAVDACSRHASPVRSMVGISQLRFLHANSAPSKADKLVESWQ